MSKETKDETQNTKKTEEEIAALEADEKKRIRAEKRAEKKKAKQAKEAHKLAQQSAKDKKKAREKKKADFDYGAIPKYFNDPAIDDEATLKLQKLQAFHWLCGTSIYAKGGMSFSAKITYTGPRPFMSRQIMLAKRSIAPNKGNWKTFIGSARIRRGQEYSGLVKDTKYIFDLLHTKGGKQNFKVRFVQDEPLAVKQEKARFLQRDETRILNLPYRIRKDQIKLGIKIPLNPGEAAVILKELSEEGLPKSSKHISEYLNQLIEKEKPQKQPKDSKA